MQTTLEALTVAQEHHRAGRLAEANAVYRRVLEADPNQLECLHLFGRLAAEVGRFDVAVPLMERAVALKPDFIEAQNDLGNVLFLQNRLDEAIEHYRKAIAARPDFAEAYGNLSTALCTQHRIAEAFAAFTELAKVTYGSRQPDFRAPEPPAHKRKHDREQIAYWLETGINRAAALAAGDSAARFDALFYLDGGERLARPAINPGNDPAAIETQWDESRTKIAVVDNLLTDEALDALRHFCWGSTIWRRIYGDGYLGAMPEHGFASPLLAQIADELRRQFPRIFRNHPLTRTWAFKCDSDHRGTRLHADFAAVNVNFWITPDDANLDPQSGGLIVWDVPAPADWNFAQYNGDVEACHDFVRRSNAKSVTIPYRANRAVIFDSDLFHETDRVTFRQGYRNRRINVTLLYGGRNSAG